MATKVHYEVEGKFLRSWTGLAYPSKGLLYAYGDGTTPAGNTHIVAFGAETEQIHPEEDIEKTKQAITHMHDVNIKRIVSYYSDLKYGAMGSNLCTGLSQLDKRRVCQGCVVCILSGICFSVS